MQGIILIGMPASGKSTIGRVLAGQLNRPFVDGDDVIVESEGMGLQTLLDQHGYLALREAEERALMAKEFHGVVLATGGSVVYSDRLVRHLRRFGPLVYLALSLHEVRGRLNNFATRGIACAPGASLEEIYAEREALYVRHADLVVAAGGQSEAELAESIKQALRDGGYHDALLPGNPLTGSPH
ncbi:shikimate kinase [Spongiibacter sp. KMU-166]|uniref:Shikimate kinase n=1 Tax=Spongiibacter thalassae TaxID=2721624 RepID=A0ABX1GJJ9_9GAMM|nr:shikimate kinase [Spongiibacter thalassae]NKI19415.1 shikimate kinase [Spongiibacter thalassae]